MTPEQQVKDLQSRLKDAVVCLGRILPTWQGHGIKAEDIAKACELLNREGWIAPPKAEGVK